MKRLTFGSLFSGIGGMDLGLERAGWRCAWQVENDPSCNRVLEKHWPDVQRFGDIREVADLPGVDLIAGGFPCQDVSVAGKQGGLDEERSGLFYEMARIIDECQPAICFWENVPGLLSSNNGRDMLRVVSEFQKIGYCGGWRTLDAQYFGMAQRRARVFGMFARRDIGTQCCAEILSLCEGMQGHPPPGREAGQRIAGTLEARTRAGGFPGTDGASAGHIVIQDARGMDKDQNGIGVSEKGVAYTLDQNACQAVAYRTAGNCGPFEQGDKTACLNTATDPNQNIIAFTERTRAEGRNLETSELAYALTNPGGGGRAHSRQIMVGSHVRRLTPRECERLQGFPDDWTSGLSDSARYRSIGNAVVPQIAEWLGRRILEVIQ